LKKWIGLYILAIFSQTHLGHPDYVKYLECLKFGF
jgi:hypothetical protein